MKTGLSCWTEVLVPAGYTSNSPVAVGESRVTAIENTHVPETTTSAVIKNWDDASDQDGKRPEKLTVVLSDGTRVTLTAADEGENGDQWKYVATGLPKYRDGVEIDYSWFEIEQLDGDYALTFEDSQRQQHDPEEYPRARDHHDRGREDLERQRRSGRQAARIHHDPAVRRQRRG